MPRYSELPRSKTFHYSTSITSNPILDFLIPSVFAIPATFNTVRRHSSTSQSQHAHFTSFFFSALSQAGSCLVHRRRKNTRHDRPKKGQKALFTTLQGKRNGEIEFRIQPEEYHDRGLQRRTRPIDPGGPGRKRHAFFDFNEQEFAASTRLPASFFADVQSIRSIVPPQQAADVKGTGEWPKTTPTRPDAGKSVKDQLNLLRSVRELEEKLAKAKRDLNSALSRESELDEMEAVRKPQVTSSTLTLSKEDYINLVDLYFYSHNSRFSPEAVDSSPTPLFLNDYSFRLSSDFSRNHGERDFLNEDEIYESPLKEVERLLKEGQLKEISVMQVFVDLLLDDHSSNRALYDVYKELPHPGVAYLPKGVIRLFLQRMSTPWTLSEKTMLRYLSLIDDMQAAKLPISLAEWSSAVYLAGRSFSRLKESDVAHAFSIWKQMESEAGVQSSNVTFNILFDIAVRAGKFALGETILKEMHERNLRLNRFGRIGLMYYHGLRGDGDGVRKAYRDFVEAGEIVDTLVLNCVIASLINAQEPIAAEQIYQRMKDIQLRRRTNTTENSDPPYKRYPGPIENRLKNETASDLLGRVLLRAPRLRDVLPENHQQLQDSMSLKPDMHTFRPMIAYHASVSGDLDKLTVLLNEMFELFNMPATTIVFQLLFKGFAIHGPRGGRSTVWSKQRLDAVWDACRNAIKASQQERKRTNTDGSHDHDGGEPTFPSISEINSSSYTLAEQSDQVHKSPALKKKLSPWDLLVIDLAAFPRERLKRIQRFHSSQFDGDRETIDISIANPASLSTTFEPSFFQEAHYDAPREEWDTEEGEYVLPSPTNSRLVDPTGRLAKDDYENEKVNPDETGEDEETAGITYRNPVIEVRATRPLVNWLLRAYARSTGSRAQVEEVFNSVRKVWRPQDEQERNHVIRVLFRCLNDCDRESGSG